MLNLKEAIANHLEAEDAEQFFGTPTVKKWIESLPTGVSAAQKVLDEYAKSAKKPALADGTIGATDHLIDNLRGKLDISNTATLAEVLDAVILGKWKDRCAMLIPTHQNIPPAVNWGIVAQVRRQPWLRYYQEKNTIIQRARNVLAKRFLESGCEWSYWQDSDIIAPYGDVGFFYNDLGLDPDLVKPEFLKVNAVDRLMSHKRSIVGGVYATRSSVNKKLVIQPDLHPRGAEDATLVHSLLTEGARDKVVSVGYVATGCALVHRQVYTDIMAKFPQFAPDNADPSVPQSDEACYNFFSHDTHRQGEDIAFSRLAAEAGHPSFLDLGLWAAHLGTHAFFPTKKKR